MSAHPSDGPPGSRPSIRSGQFLRSDLFTLPAPRESWARILLATVTGSAVLGLMALVTDTLMPLIIISFGASTLLVLLLPHAPVSHPLVVLGGNMVCGIIGLLAQWGLPASWWRTGLAFGVSLFALAALRLVHPPATGITVALVLSEGESWTYLFTPVLLGTLLIVGAGAINRRIILALERPRPNL